uniref:Uncharacterized protein n=1 Tax=Arundo donax TaxID=35708 RepID=A0A0A9BAR8_ARUDO
MTVALHSICFPVLSSDNLILLLTRMLNVP